MKCEVCEQREAVHTVTVMDIAVCTQCKKGSDLVLALVGDVAALGVSEPLAVTIVDDALENALRKLTN